MNVSAAIVWARGSWPEAGGDQQRCLSSHLLPPPSAGFYAIASRTIMSNADWHSAAKLPFLGETRASC